MLIRSSGFAAAAVLGMASFVMAQAAPREEPRPQNPPMARPGAAPQAHAQAGNLDEGIATCIVLGSRNEVEICKFVRDRLKTEEARNFADMMIKEHSAALERLEKFAGHSAAPVRGGRTDDRSGDNPRAGEGARAGEDRTGPQPQPRDPNARPGVRVDAAGAQVEVGRDGVAVGRAAPANQGNTDAQWNQIKHELAAECLTSAKRELEEAEKHDLDKCFLGLQIAGHMKMVGELKVFSNHASQNLRGELQANQQAAQKHLDHAKKIMESLKSDHKETTGANPPRAERKEEPRSERKE